MSLAFASSNCNVAAYARGIRCPCSLFARAHTYVQPFQTVGMLTVTKAADFVRRAQYTTVQLSVNHTGFANRAVLHMEGTFRSVVSNKGPLSAVNCCLDTCHVC